MSDIRIGEALDDIGNLSHSYSNVPFTPRLGSLNESSVSEDEDICRICMEGESETYPLIHPCKCSGSVKYIHEECLKTWITSHIEEIDKSVCELCTTAYVMEIKMTSNCSLKEAMNQGMSACMFTPLLFTVFVILIVILYLLIHSYLPEAGEGEESGYIIGFIVACLLGSLAVLGLIVNSCKNACMTTSILSWRILSLEVPEDIRIAADINQEDSNIQPDNAQLIESEVFVVPATVKIKGKRVRTPILSPCLTPLRSVSSSIAFASPKIRSANATPIRSRVATFENPYAKVQPEGL